MAEICELEPHLPGQWERNGNIPYRWWLHICHRGQAAKIPITPIEFIVDLSVAYVAMQITPPTSGPTPASSAVPA